MGKLLVPAPLNNGIGKRHLTVPISLPERNVSWPITTLIITPPISITCQNHATIELAQGQKFSTSLVIYEMACKVQRRWYLLPLTRLWQFAWLILQRHLLWRSHDLLESIKSAHCQKQITCDVRVGLPKPRALTNHQRTSQQSDHIVRKSLLASRKLEMRIN